jgi:ribulose-5-phosphate 4-epimerase/fuculose-1-phosphate aldolase
MEGNGEWSAYTYSAVMSSSNQPSSQTPYHKNFYMSNPNIAWILPSKPLFVKS